MDPMIKYRGGKEKIVNCMNCAHFCEFKNRPNSYYVVWGICYREESATHPNLRPRNVYMLDQVCEYYIHSDRKETLGEWLPVDELNDAFDCSYCGAMVGRKTLYCPGCGKKMNREEEK